MIWYLGEGWGFPFIQFLVADTVVPGLPFCYMDFTRCTAREFTARLMGEDEVWFSEAQPPWLPCQAQQSVGRNCPGQPRLRTETSGQQRLKEYPGSQVLPSSLHIAMESRVSRMSPPPSNLSSINIKHENSSSKDRKHPASQVP